eukprot:SAG31_NODE_2068_length_6521_cov_6.298194_8_plen_75_part_00
MGGWKCWFRGRWLRAELSTFCDGYGVGGRDCDYTLSTHFRNINNNLSTHFRNIHNKFLITTIHQVSLDKSINIC